MSAPEKIYRGEQSFLSESARKTYLSETRLHDGDVEYIRADIHEAQIKAENAELREILQDAIISHGTFIAYNPLEDAWQFRRIESRARELLEKVRP